MLAHPGYSSPPPYSYGHTHSSLVPPTSTPVPQHNGGHDSCTENHFFDKKDSVVSAETSVQ
ncbi:hypothetical protein EXN66_Car009665 [Channa argus]|uniref:Uncharacterized protein n=1 Tax=Channa argus TaxID=215402 RepID=A0A6G1PUS9_CHAAH|nr:hypothetical protein EXN66_Car009665 [Channa argus]